VIRAQFNSGIAYRGRVLKWDTVIDEKASETARFLTEETSMVDFVEPSPKLDRLDDRELRERSNSLTLHEAKKRGLGKSTVHHLRKNARSKDMFRVYRK
jgi:CRISPR-associated protein Cas1